MTTRVLTPAQQALKKGFVPFLRHMWEHEPVVTVSIVIGTVPIIGYILTPKSAIDRRDAYVKSLPRHYPKLIRYVEGKTGPPTVV